MILIWSCLVLGDCLFCFFFFKQKTAYEMRISDWSSDVCSSDLAADHQRRRDDLVPLGTRNIDDLPKVGRVERCDGYGFLEPVAQSVGDGLARAGQRRGGKIARRERQKPGGQRIAARSEEQTSELQSLMRTSYAVVCLQKT